MKKKNILYSGAGIILVFSLVLNFSLSTKGNMDNHLGDLSSLMNTAQASSECYQWMTYCGTGSMSWECNSNYNPTDCQLYHCYNCD